MFPAVGSVWQQSVLVVFGGTWRLQPLPGTGKRRRAPAEPCSQGTLGLFMACGTDVAPLPFAVSRSPNQPQGVCPPGRQVDLEGLEAGDPDERDHAPVSPFLCISGHFLLGDCGGLEQSLWNGCFAAEGANEPLNICLHDSLAPNVVSPMALFCPCA